jgi:murein DD-endopeptidase MepM/ murein hydrolase activator NlpD
MFFGRGTAVYAARPAAERPQQSVTRGAPQAPTATAATAATHPSMVTVQSGDTLYGISRQYNVPIRAIINANNLTPPYNLAVGRPLVLPQQPFHRVNPGETVASIARTYGVSTQELLRANGIEAPYLIYVGQPIVLPVAAPQGAVAVAGVPPQQDSSQDNTARTAPTVMTPPAGSGGTRLPPPGAPNSPVVTEGPPSGPVAGDSIASLPPPSAPVEPPISAPPGAFIWPVQGRIISGFGSKPGGLVNDGINIAAPAGTPIRASQDGTVAYAGNELRGYGNLLLVRHENGWMTAYAHAGELLVTRGDRVKRGQTIARVGASGSVGEPQLHFEIRQGTRSVDPTRYLSGQAVGGRS